MRQGEGTSSCNERKKTTATPPLGLPNDFQAPALQFNPIPLQQADFITASSEGRADEMNTIKGACKQSEAAAFISLNSGTWNHLKGWKKEILGVSKQPFPAAAPFFLNKGDFQGLEDTSRHASDPKTQTVQQPCEADCHVAGEKHP